VNLFTLFQDGTGTMKPDVLISDGSGIKLVMDAKYKLDEPVAEPDYYQMAAYLNAYKVNKGVLVFPSLALQPTIVARKTQSRQVIYELRLPLTDWSLTEQTLVAETRNLLQ
jgi:5-methylcytosine-specific restriction endonuclease McrBC regulatory subunit McrC